MTHKRNVEGLKSHQEKKNQETILKVNEAIDRLKRSRTKSINFKTVAEEAGISKATLYNNAILKERILSLRAVTRNIEHESTTGYSKDNFRKKDEKIKALYDQIKKLKKEQEDLIVQLIEMEELRDENIRLRLALEKNK